MKYRKVVVCVFFLVSRFGNFVWLFFWLVSIVIFQNLLRCGITSNIYRYMLWVVYNKNDCFSFCQKRSCIASHTIPNSGVYGLLFFLHSNTQLYLLHAHAHRHTHTYSNQCSYLLLATHISTLQLCCCSYSCLDLHGRHNKVSSLLIVFFFCCCENIICRSITIFSALLFFFLQGLSIYLEGRGPQQLNSTSNTSHILHTLFIQSYQTDTVFFCCFHIRKILN